jgi:hypothetical protein
VFNSFEAQGWADGSQVFGENGDDFINTGGNHDILDGGDGNDQVFSEGNYNLMIGGNGNDQVGANGHYNLLLGGSGDDFLLSVGGSGGDHETGIGNLMIGGSGHDTFAPVGASDLAVTNDTNGVLSEGDHVVGVFDLIGDYRFGEDMIQTGATHRVSTVALDTNFTPATAPDIHASSPDHEHLLLNSGDYDVVRGNLAHSGEFDVSQTGRDLLILSDNSIDYYHHAVVLLGNTNPDWVMVV